MVDKAISLSLPLKEEDILRLRAGDRVLLTGVLYTARDAAHKRLVEALERGEKLPLDLKGQVLYYVGPSPTPPGEGRRLRRAHLRLQDGQVHPPAPPGRAPGHDRQRPPLREDKGGLKSV